MPFCTRLSTCTLAYSHPLHNYTPTRHSAPQPSAYNNMCRVQQQQKFTTCLILQHAIQTQHCSCTPHFLYTRQTTSATLSGNPQHDFSMHINMHYTAMQYYPPYCLPHPSMRQCIGAGDFTRVSSKAKQAFGGKSLHVE